MPRRAKRIITGTLTVLIIVSFHIAAPLPAKAREDSSENFATVNGQPISRNFFEASYNFQLAGLRFFHSGETSDETRRQKRREVSERLITRALLIQEAERTGNFPSQEEINVRVQRAFTRYGTREKLLGFLEENDVSLDDFTKMTVDSFKATYYLDQLKKKVSISDSQCLEYYERNITQYRPPRTANFSVIKFQFSSKNVDPELVQEIQSLSNSPSFESMKSQLPGVRSKIRLTKNEVKIQVVENLKSPPESKRSNLWNAINSATPGVPYYWESDENDGIYQLLMLNRIQTPPQQSFEQVKGQIRQKLQSQEQERVALQKIQDLRLKALIEVHMDINVLPKVTRDE